MWRFASYEPELVNDGALAVTEKAGRKGKEKLDSLIL
jgi:hypothetical protein